MVQLLQGIINNSQRYRSLIVVPSFGVRNSALLDHLLQKEREPRDGGVVCLLRAAHHRDHFCAEESHHLWELMRVRCIERMSRYLKHMKGEEVSKSGNRGKPYSQEGGKQGRSDPPGFHV